MLLKIGKHQQMLPYDGMIRTGSKGVSHFACGKDPQRVAQLTGKVAEKQPCLV
jgi:hypothetical protein